MRNLSIRWRLTIWYAVVLAAALGLFSGLTWFSLRQKLANDVEQELNASAGRFQNYFAREAAELPAGKSPDQLKDELEEFCQALPASEYRRATRRQWVCISVSGCGAAGRRHLALPGSGVRGGGRYVQPEHKCIPDSRWSARSNCWDGCSLSLVPAGDCDRVRRRRVAEQDGR